MQALVSKEEVQQDAADELIDKVFDGSAGNLVAALLSRKKLSREEIDKLRCIVDELEQ